jgi:hypothetical protein
MAERRVIVDNMVIRYEGLFSFHDLMNVIDEWQRQRGYDKFERKNFEQVFKTGKDIEIELEPWKEINESEKISIRVVILIKKMKDVIIKVDGQEVRRNQGHVMIKFTASLLTDFAYKWEGKPLYFFLKEVVDKYIYRLPVAKHEGFVAEEANSLYRNVRGYLNLVRR